MAQEPVLISATGLLTWLECRRMAMYRKKWEQISVSKAMKFGKLFHQMLERSHLHTEECSNEVVAHVIREEQDTNAGSWGAEEQQDFELLAAKLEAVFPRYETYWEGYSPDYVAREWRFSLPVPEWDNVILVGFIDGVYRMKRSKKKFGIEENKTKGRIEEGQVTELLERDFQTCFYVWATEREHGPCVEVTFDIARNPGMGLTKKDGSLQRFAKRVEDDIDKRPEHYFHRFRMPVEERTKKLFEAELEDLCKEYAAWYRAGMPSTLFGNPCVGKYGMCSYVPICYRDDTGRFKETKPYVSLKSAEEQIAEEGSRLAKKAERKSSGKKKKRSRRKV